MRTRNPSDPTLTPKLAKIPHLAGAWMRKQRQKLGLTQRQMADLCDLNQRTISAFECGSHEPGLTSLLSIFRALKLDREATGKALHSWWPKD